MREIKFRGLSHDNNEWVYGYFLTKSLRWGFKAIIYTLGLDEESPDLEHHVKHDSICQYTGLKDKNGKEIYEGDILEARDKSGTIIIEYGGGCFYGKNINPDSTFKETLNRNWLDWYLIGNIYQNPNLLTKE